MSGSTATPTRSDRADRASTPLLALIGQGAVDEDYARLARRRVQAGAPPSVRGRHLVAAAGVACFGLLIAVAAVSTARNSDIDSASRQLLVQRIGERRAAVADQQDQIRSLRRENATLQSTRRRLDATLGGATSQLIDQEQSTGFLGVTGPGLRVTVDDNPDGDPDGRVRATDLRLLVNALWAAGADAVSINGRRLTTLSSIVNASIAVQVNRGPVSPPYDVVAVGNLSTLTGALTDTDTGQAFAALGEQFGFQVQPEPVTDLTVTAAPAGQLRLREVRTTTTGPSDQDGVS